MLRDVWHGMGDSRPKCDEGGDPIVAELAIRQRGVVGVAQLRAAGLSASAVKYRRKRGRLHRVHTGVYAVGHPRLDERGRLWAAVLACGGPASAIARHRPAAAVWALLPEPPRADVATLKHRRSTTRIRVHRLGDLDPRRDVVTHPDGLRVTTPTRTLIDLAAILTGHRLERLCHRAEHLRLLDTRPLREVTNRPGAAKLRHALETLV